MGDLIPFRRRQRRWTKARHYQPVLPQHRWQGLSRRRRFFNMVAAWRPWVLLLILLSGWYYTDPGLIEPPAFLSSEPEPVTGSFTRCGLGRGVNCVIDGDTFKLDERKIRVIGIDAPEMHPPRCPAEQAQGEAATAALQRVLNEGPFAMVGRIDGGYDQYGRDLRSLSRPKSDGSTESIADAMLATGTVRRYLGGLRGDWC